MGIINKLSPHEAQKIAAGEVIERPYNIVKELIENALDAKATHIILYIQDGGKQSIRCVDNGVGMSEEDARLSIERHATSKLAKIEDLDTLQTFGFRGEALASLCSVSNLTLATQMHTASHGIQLTFDYASLVREEIISRAPGTDITLNNLFGNIPARKKFLKTRETEWRAIYTLVQAMALAHHDVAFTVYHEKQLMLNTHQTTDLTERIAQIFDRSFSEQFLEFTSGTTKDILISGGITHYQYQRYDRNQQFFFVNKRWVKNYKLSQAFNRGFQRVMPPGKHPAGIIFITIAQQEVDVNVHPRKEEVVFLHSRIIENALESAIQKRLESETATRIQQMEPLKPLQPTLADSLPTYNSQARHPFFEQPPFVQPSNIIQSMATQQIIAEPSIHNSLVFSQIESTVSYTIVGQLSKTYILLETSSGLLIVDQHAAHEAVLYEQLTLRAGATERIQLLFPEIISLQAESLHTIIAFASELEQLGIHIEHAGDNTVAVTQTPLMLKNYALKDLIHDIILWVEEGGSFDRQTWHTKIRKKLYAMMACKAAVKAGDELSAFEMDELLKSLYKTEHRLTCPHGRPTTWLMSHYELERTFKRKI